MWGQDWTSLLEMFPIFNTINLEANLAKKNVTVQEMVNYYSILMM